MVRKVPKVTRYVPLANRAGKHKDAIRRWLVRNRVSMVGILGTALLHILLISPAVFGNRTSEQSKPFPLGESLLNDRSAEETSMIWLDLSSISDAQEPADSSAADTGMPLAELEIPQLSPEALPDQSAETEPVDSRESIPESGQFAALYGKYREQVLARINRAWMRPRSALDAHGFQCDVRVQQDRQGNVLSIEMERCDDDARWRQSLTSAILRASPLSAPSEPWLFTDALTLRFSAVDYLSSGGPESDYEPEPRRVADVGSQSNLDLAIPAPETWEPASTNADLDLTIVGGEIRWKKKEPSINSR